MLLPALSLCSGLLPGTAAQDSRKFAVAVFSMAGGSPSAWESWNLHSGVAESSRNFSWNEAQQFETKDSQVHGVAGGEGTTGLQYRVEYRVCDSTKC